MENLSDEARALRALALLHESISDRRAGRDDASGSGEGADDEPSEVSGPALTA